MQSTKNKGKYLTEKEEAMQYGKLSLFAMFVLLPGLLFYWALSSFVDLFRAIDLKVTRKERGDLFEQ